MPETMPAAPAATEAPPAPATMPTTTPTTTEAERTMPQTPPTPPATDPAAEAIRAERDRIADLGPVLAASRALVTPGVADALHQRAIAEGWAPDALRGALWDAMVQGAKPPAVPAAPANTAPTQGDPLVMREAMAEALAVRAMPGYQAQDGGRHSEFLGWRPSEMVAELMRARGERNVPRETAKLAELVPEAVGSDGQLVPLPVSALYIKNCHDCSFKILHRTSKILIGTSVSTVTCLNPMMNTTCTYTHTYATHSHVSCSFIEVVNILSYCVML
jgi:hypothetical protein